MQRFGEKLRILRERHGISQRELGKKLGFSSSAYVHFLETGQRKPNVELLLKLSDLFGVTMDVLVKDELEVGEDTP
jgi:transcriptional regulator with XRE-family HTH domain